MALSTGNNMITVAQRLLEAVNEDAKVADAIMRGDPRVASLGAFERQNTLRLNLVSNLWRKIGRQVLAMHPAVVDEVKVASSDKVPGEILKTLPYLNPLVIFDEPPVFKSWLPKGQVHQRSVGRERDEPEAYLRLLGFFTFATSTVTVAEKGGLSRVEQRVYSTTDPDADRFGLLLILEVLSEGGKSLGLEFNSITLYFSDNLTLAETVESVLTRFHFDSDTVDRNAKRWMRELLSTVMGTLFYLCSTVLEAERVPAKSVAKKMSNKTIARQPLSMYRVGWTMGGALTRVRRERARSADPSQQGDISHQQDPQHRRGHFKMQPYGPNKSLRKLIYVSPYWTHIERLGVEGVNVARRVPSLGKGEPRDSMRTALETGNVKIETS